MTGTAISMLLFTSGVCLIVLFVIVLVRVVCSAITTKNNNVKEEITIHGALFRFFDTGEIIIMPKAGHTPWTVRLKNGTIPEGPSKLLPGEWAVNRKELLIYIGNEDGVPEKCVLRKVPEFTSSHFKPDDTGKPADWKRRDE